MELKASECRYGNFIIGTYESEDDNLVHETICEFKFYDCYNNYYNVESKERIEEFTGLKPIPLTEEWLLKFGFEEDGVWIHKTIKLEHDRMLGIDLNNNHFFLSQWDKKKNFRDCFLVKCEFVHQLQNLFYSICGKELEIKM